MKGGRRGAGEEGWEASTPSPRSSAGLHGWPGQGPGRLGWPLGVPASDNAVPQADSKRSCAPGCPSSACADAQTLGAGLYPP